jgi:Ser/Thr protein kinase RdoA (MazF antagonist)
MKSPPALTALHKTVMPDDVLLELARIATFKYNLPDDLTIVLINHSENATYKVEATTGQSWALRIHREGYHSHAAIASELAWLIDLRARGVVTTPKPVAGKDGETIQIVSHPKLLTPRHVVLSHWEAGQEPSIKQDLIKPFETLGEVAARMHAHTKAWVRPANFQRPTWNFETSLGESNPHWGRWREGLGVDAEKQKLFSRTVKRIGQRLNAYGNSSAQFGLIHCDLRLANLLIDQGAVKVIDFDDCGFSWYMYDAATPVSFYEHEPQVPALIDAWKVGYRKAGTLSREDENEIPTFVMLRRLLLVAWIGSHAETDLAKSMGVQYTEGTMALCDAYLKNFA